MNQKIVVKYAILGTGVWVLATGLVRWVGQWVMVSASNPLYLAFLGATALFAVVLVFIFRKEPKEARLVGAISFVLPEMVLDILTFLCYGCVYPNLAPGSMALFGVWALFAYLTILAAGIWSLRD